MLVKFKVMKYYTIEDIKFRLVRDMFLTKKQYEEIMFLMMKEKKFNFKKFYSRLFFDTNDTCLYKLLFL